MVLCPLCEEAQPRAEACRVCGRPLGGPGAAAAGVEPVPGLEPTRLADAGPALVEPVPGLEPTLREAAPEVPAEAGWLEPTAAPDVGAVQGESIEIERDVRAPPSPRAGDPAPACRYCGEAAGPADAFCGRCGMKLPRVGFGAPR